MNPTDKMLVVFRYEWHVQLAHSRRPDSIRIPVGILGRNNTSDVISVHVVGDVVQVQSEEIQIKT